MTVYVEDPGRGESDAVVRVYASEDATEPMRCTGCNKPLGAEPFSTGPEGGTCNTCLPLTPAFPRVRTSWWRRTVATARSRVHR